MTAPESPVSPTVVTPCAQQSRMPCFAAASTVSKGRAALRAMSWRIQAGKSVGCALWASRPVSSRWVWALTRPGSSAPVMRSVRTPGGAGTPSVSGPTAAMRPSTPTSTAPLGIGTPSPGQTHGAVRRRGPAVTGAGGG